MENLLALNAIDGLGPVRLKSLLEFFGSAQAIFNAPTKDIMATGIVPQNVASAIVSFKRDEFLKKELDHIKERGVQIVSIFDTAYPKNLKDIYDAPVILYIKGTLSKDNDLAVAMVGSRQASLYGITVAEKFSMRLSELGITVVSGMARGIDSAAHRGVLKARGKTIAVLGNGLSVVYPPENKKLFDDISKEGCILSEFPMGTPPAVFNFPRRNRIISGLSLGVVVVEASRKSGALITSRFALEQGREVFAVPGSIDSPQSQGVHELIKQGAKLIGRVEDILEELALPMQISLKSNENHLKEHTFVKNRIAHLTEDEKNVYEGINREASHIDEILSKVQIPQPKAIEILLKLELKDLVRQMPGKYFVRKEE